MHHNTREIIQICLDILRQIVGLIHRNEMKFLALTLLIGTAKKPELSDYWSTNALLKGSVFISVIPYNCYQTIFTVSTFC